MSRRRPEPSLRLRPGRLLAALVSLVVTGVAFLGGVGALPASQSRAYAAHTPGPLATSAGSATVATSPSGRAIAPRRPAVRPTPAGPDVQPTSTPLTRSPESRSTDLPSATGVGKRVVLDLSAQRVWLVDGNDEVVRTYLVSGSPSDKLERGDYTVLSRSRAARGIDGPGRVADVVSFGQGRHAVSGFHGIPTRNGQRVQPFSQLGIAVADEGIRQRPGDARRMWRFARVGTDVRVIR